MVIQGSLMEVFREIVFCDFVVAWQSLQLPKQKEGLFHKDLRISVRAKSCLRDTITQT